jgi:omega-hydroxy-beta-dihydromenaquinone-9 sulfotransferase
VSEDLSRKNNSSHSLKLWFARWLFTPLAGVTFGNWLRLLRKHGRNIHPFYWARNLFTMSMAIMNSGVASIEKARYGKEIGTVKIKSPVFVVGHHRSGTTHLWNILTQDQRFAYPTVLQSVFPHTFLVFENAVHGLAKKFAPAKRPQDNVEFNPDSPMEAERAISAATFLSIQMARHFPQKRDLFKKYLTMREADEEEKNTWKTAVKEFAQKLLIRHGRDSILLFKGPDQTAKIRLLLELFPDARFIHIHRDPYEVFRSTMNMEKKTIPLYAYQKTDFRYLEDFVLWRYSEMYDAFLEDIELIPEGQFTQISFEELEKNPLETIEKVYRDVRLPSFDEAKSSIVKYLDSIADYKKNRYPELPDDQKKKIQLSWKRYLEAFGYKKRAVHQNSDDLQKDL